MKQTFIISEYTVKSQKLKNDFKAAVIADIHLSRYKLILEAVKEHKADLILVPGDFIIGSDGEERWCSSFFSAAAKIAPVAVCPGNHEYRHPDFDRLMKTCSGAGATVLINESAEMCGVSVGGLADSVDTEWLKSYTKKEGFKLLMCHRPEFFLKFVNGADVDLTVSGHAHGGQIRLFGHGLFSVGQGAFPKYTSGFYFGSRLLVSRGLGNHSIVPRLFNPPELMFIDFKKL